MPPAPAGLYWWWRPVDEWWGTLSLYREGVERTPQTALRSGFCSVDPAVMAVTARSILDWWARNNPGALDALCPFHAGDTVRLGDIGQSRTVTALVGDMLHAVNDKGVSHSSHWTNWHKV